MYIIFTNPIKKLIYFWINSRRKEIAIKFLRRFYMLTWFNKSESSYITPWSARPRRSNTIAANQRVSISYDGLNDYLPLLYLKHKKIVFAAETRGFVRVIFVFFFRETDDILCFWYSKIFQLSISEKKIVIRSFILKVILTYILNFSQIKIRTARQNLVHIVFFFLYTVKCSKLHRNRTKS